MCQLRLQSYWSDKNLCYKRLVWNFFLWTQWFLYVGWNREITSADFWSFTFQSNFSFPRIAFWHRKLVEAFHKDTSSTNKIYSWVKIQLNSSCFKHYKVPEPYNLALCIIICITIWPFIFTFDIFGLKKSFLVQISISWFTAEHYFYDVVTLHSMFFWSVSYICKRWPLMLSPGFFPLLKHLYFYCIELLTKNNGGLFVWDAKKSAF